MASRYWMITNRKAVEKNGKITLGKDDAKQLSFYTCPLDAKDPKKLGGWSEHSAAEFRKEMIAAAGTFPELDDEANEEQKHVTIFVHGYNNAWEDAFDRYRKLVADLYAGEGGLGECILFAWPSDGSTAGYLPDRRDARASADDLGDVLSWLYEWLLRMQANAAPADDAAGVEAAAADKEAATATKAGVQCRAKTSIIAHSMGAYVVQCAMQDVWTRKNKPLLLSLINQLLLVSADVDNNLFASGEQVGEGAGEGIANLAYRITALYTGLDSVLGMSAKLKHFGKRRVGRSGLDRSQPLPDNVWDVDMTSLFDMTVKRKSYHSAAFDDPTTVGLIRELLRGVDRRILVARGLVPAQDKAVTLLTGEGTAPAA